MRFIDVGTGEFLHKELMVNKGELPVTRKQGGGESFFSRESMRCFRVSHSLSWDIKNPFREASVRQQERKNPMVQHVKMRRE